ncbi:MAG: HNH endonuclease [Candidatus Eisenbacteria bacterium]|nr:HNH endonuclease [Candidatus Eisenbacteria bacterium]
MSADGRRCECRTNLEFDHVVPLARGGLTTVENVRLCCRAHNQYAAERVFGEGFMRGKRAWGRIRAASATTAGATP